MIVVSDTSPVANLIQIDRLDLLHQLYHRILVPPTVYQEIKVLETFGIDLAGFQAANWIEQQIPARLDALASLRADLDSGELEAIALALETSADWILMDERAGTRVAEQRGLRPVGLLGVLIRAKNQGFIDEVLPIVDELRTMAGFWVSDGLVIKLRRLVQE